MSRKVAKLPPNNAGEYSRRLQCNPILETCRDEEVRKDEGKGTRKASASEKFYTNTYAASTSGAGTVALMYVMNAFAQTVSRY